MSYIGRDVDNISNVEKLDNITFDGSATYALEKSSVAYTPSGANNILISIDGVVQQGNFSVSTTNIVFDWSPTSSNTCDWILHFGTGLITTTADSSVTASKLGSLAVTGAKLNTDVISAQTELASAPADADEFMVSDGGVLKRIDYSLIKGGANTPACLVIMDANRTLSNDTLTKIEFDDEQYDTASAFDATTNYRFTVPVGEAGKYFVHFDADFNSGTSAGLLYSYLYLYKNGAELARNTWDFADNYIKRSNLNITNVLELAESDYIEAYVYVNDDADNCSLNGNGTHFMMFKIIE